MRALVWSELKQRMRGRRWWIVLALWTLVLWGLLALIRSTTMQADPYSLDPTRVGPVMFGFLSLLVLALASLIVPALSATTINGERDRGTLAPLQATLLRPRQIIGAKFLAAWITGGAFVAATFPLAAWSYGEGDVAVVQVGVVYLVLFLLTGVLAAIGVTASTFLARPSLSTVTAYGAVFLMTALLPVFFGLAVATAPQTPEVGPGGFTSTERVIGWRWLLLAADPFVVLADAAPTSSDEGFQSPLAAIREGARYSRGHDEFGFQTGGAVWPAGLAIDLGIGAAGLYLSVRRLRIPARRLPRGQRVA